MRFFSKSVGPRVGLALSGGSALGIAHIGVLRAFQESGIAIDCISGTSAGSVAAACLAFGVPVEAMLDRAKSLQWRALSKPAYSRMGWASTAGIGALIESSIGSVNIEDAKIPLAIVATDIESGKPVVFREGSLSRAVMASCCIPGYFAPVAHEGKLLVDGGVVENLPVSPLLTMGAELTIGVTLLSKRAFKKPRHVLDVMLNTMSIMTNVQTEAHGARAGIVIEPDVEDFSSGDFSRAEELVAAGYRAALAMMPTIQETLRVRRRSRGEKLLRRWLPLAFSK